MKQCCLDQFIGLLTSWLHQNCIKAISLGLDSQVLLSFIEGVSDVYKITNCNRFQLEIVCQDLKENGITVIELL